MRVCILILAIFLVSGVALSENLRSSTPPTLEFRRNDPGQLKYELVTITNNGSFGIEFVRASIENDNYSFASDSGVLQNCAGPLAPHTSCTAKVVLSGTAVPPLTGKVKFSYTARNVPYHLEFNLNPVRDLHLPETIYSIYGFWNTDRWADVTARLVAGPYNIIVGFFDSTKSASTHWNLIQALSRDNRRVVHQVSKLFSRSLSTSSPLRFKECDALDPGLPTVRVGLATTVPLRNELVDPAIRYLLCQWSHPFKDTLGGYLPQGFESIAIDEFNFYPDVYYPVSEISTWTRFASIPTTDASVLKLINRIAITDADADQLQDIYDQITTLDQTSNAFIQKKAIGWALNNHNMRKVYTQALAKLRAAYPLKGIFVYAAGGWFTGYYNRVWSGFTYRDILKSVNDHADLFFGEIYVGFYNANFSLYASAYQGLCNMGSSMPNPKNFYNLRGFRVLDSYVFPTSFSSCPHPELVQKFVPIAAISQKCTEPYDASGKVDNKFCSDPTYSYPIATDVGFRAHLHFQKNLMSKLQRMFIGKFAPPPLRKGMGFYSAYATKLRTLDWINATFARP